MRLYRLASRFHRRTGKQLTDELVEDCLICDFTGKIIETSGEFGTQNSITIHDSSEENWYYDDAPIIDKIEIFNPNLGKYEVIAQLNSSEYVFSVDESGYDCSFILFGKWIESKEEDYFGKCASLYDVLRFCRYRTLNTLLERGKITIQQLGFLRG